MDDDCSIMFGNKNVRSEKLINVLVTPTQLPFYRIKIE
jgi:hypothetical protein